MAFANPFDQKLKFKFTNKIKSLRPLNDHVIVTDMNFGQRTLSSGIILMNDDGKTDGIRPRWAKVYAVGPDQKDVTPGQWILIEHGRWTRGVEVEIDGVEFTIRRVDATSIMMVSDEQPVADDMISTAVPAERKTRENWAEY
jgi:co-chaperonin GroES (HSP10)